MKIWDYRRKDDREKGVLLPVFSLPSGYGIGCFSKEAMDFIDWLRDTGHTYWQILPLNPTGNADSPYQPLSSFAGNPYFIDPAQLVQQGLLTEEELADIPSLKVGLIGFTAAAVVLGLVCPFMVRAAEQISEITGLGASFVGSTLVALVTSLPEMVTSISAISIGAADMALGNLFGSNMFNMFGIGIADIFYTKGRFLGTVDNSFVVVGMLGVLMTAFGLLGNIVKFKRVGKVMDVDSIIMTVMYIGGMYILYVMSNGI